MLDNFLQWCYNLILEIWHNSQASLKAVFLIANETFDLKAPNKILESLFKMIFLMVGLIPIELLVNALMKYELLAFIYQI